jgi:hypothetical protein
MEPVRQLSGYRNGYYCAPKDNATCYYFDMMGKGRHTIETEYYIDRTGTYETGACTVQCAYAPAFHGITKSQTIIIKYETTDDPSADVTGLSAGIGSEIEC